jgi:integrase
MGKLTDLQIRQAKAHPDKRTQLPDGNGLYVEIMPGEGCNTTKTWRYRFRLRGTKQPLPYTIGPYPQVSLTEARDIHRELYKLVKAGEDPRVIRALGLDKKKTEQENTFEWVSKQWIQKNRARWAPYYLKQIESGFATHVYPKIGKLPLTSITSHKLLALLEPVAEKAPTVAVNLKLWIGAVFRFGVTRLLVDTDPTAALKGAIKKPRAKHHAPLKPADIPEFLRKAKAYQGVCGIALQLLLYTFVRPGELRCATWDEFDYEHGLWRIPATRMKMRREHLIPLSPQVLELLEQLYAVTGGTRSGLLLPNMRDRRKPMSNTSFNRALEYMGYAGAFSSHGFRATASTILNEAGFHPDVIEKQLAHEERNQSRAPYNQAKYLDQRHEMMRQWADYVDALADGKNNAIATLTKQLKKVT